MIGDCDCVADIIPVDLCVNLIIAAAWSTAIRKFVTITNILLKNDNCFGFVTGPNPSPSTIAPLDRVTLSNGT